MGHHCFDYLIFKRNFVGQLAVQIDHCSILVFQSSPFQRRLFYFINSMFMSVWRLFFSNKLKLMYEGICELSLSYSSCLHCGCCDKFIQIINRLAIETSVIFFHLHILLSQSTINKNHIHTVDSKSHEVHNKIW